MVMLIGEQCVLREVGLDDWPAIHAYSVCPEVVCYQPWGPNTPEESCAFVAQVVAVARATPRTYN